MQQPNYENISLSTTLQLFCEKVKVESKTEIPSGAVVRVLETNAFASVTESRAEEGSLYVGGKVIYQIFYQDDESVLRKYECGSEFSTTIKDDSILATDKSEITLSIDKTAIDLSGAKANVSAVLNVCTHLKRNVLLSVVGSGDGLVVNRTDKQLTKSLGICSSNYPIQEEFELSYPVKEMLTNTVSCVVTNAQCGVGCIIVDGELIFNGLVVKNDDDRTLVKENRIFPFRVEIEHGDAMPSLLAIAKGSVKTFKTDVSVDPDENKSVATLSVTSHFFGEVVATEQITYPTDSFSVSENLELGMENVSVCYPLELISHTTNLNGRATREEIAEETKIVGTGGEKIEITSTKIDGDKLCIEGVLSVNTYLLGDNQKKTSVLLETPFTTTIERFESSELTFEVVANVKSSNARRVSLTEWDIEGEVVFTIYPYKTDSIKYLKEVKGVGEKQIEDRAISVYIAIEGEELWDLSKRLNVCPNELVLTNKELQFPLSGKERIVIYRQK